jgi:hypothetical protein
MFLAMRECGASFGSVTEFSKAPEADICAGGKLREGPLEAS